MFNILKNLFRKRQKIFLTSDLHLDHENIIKLANRPFKDVHKMNYALIKNWNKTVNKRDLVYFLGDFVFKGERRQRVRNFIHSLNGRKIFIRGNHDIRHNRNVFSGITKSYHHYVLKYSGEYFYLVHNPSDIPSNWNGWAIVGHTHNKGLFIDRKNKRINVSTENTGYKPISIDNLLRIIHQNDS